VKVLAGNLGFTVLVPIVKITATNISWLSSFSQPVYWGTSWRELPFNGTIKAIWKVILASPRADITVPVGSYNSIMR
jgi:hypothetical protein